jgi:hypothetical protein
MKFLYFFLCLAMLAFPVAADSGGPPPSFWVCRQIGTMEKTNTLAFADVFQSNGNALEKEKVFERTVKKITKGAFQPSFEPQCTEYSDYRRAQKGLEKNLKLAKKRNFQLFHINLSRRK